MAAGLENEVSALKLQLQKEVSEKLVFKNRCESIEGEARLNQNRFDEQMVRLKKATERINYRSKVLDRLESGLIDLYFEVQDRGAYSDAALATDKDGFQTTHLSSSTGRDGFADGGGTLATREEQESQEKVAFLKEVNNDPIVLLDYLRAILRIQLAFKDEYEGELRGAMESRQSQHEAGCSSFSSFSSHHNQSRSASFSSHHHRSRSTSFSSHHHQH
jgi:hypothetical protein